MKNYLIASSALIGALSGLPTVAYAQESEIGAKPSRYDEIIVTARKRAEKIQETPLSLSAFTALMIEYSGVQNMSDIAKLTPGLSLDEDFGRFASTRPVIRGQSVTYGEPGVSTFIDGVLINGSLLDYDLSDVERIEVIKGPQSALYGRNTYAGAINIISKSPAEEASADIKIDVGSFDRFEVAASMRGTLSKAFSGSVNARFYSRGGVFTNIYDGSEVGQQQSASVSGVLYYEPSSDLSIRTRVRYSRLDDDQLRSFNTSVSLNNVFQNNGGVYNGNFSYYNGEITARPISVDDVRLLGEKGFDRADDIQASITSNYQLNENWDVEFINGINFRDSRSKNDIGNTSDSLNPFLLNLGPAFPTFGGNFFYGYLIEGPVADFALDTRDSTTDYSSELRFNYQADSLSAMFGGYFYNGRDKSQSLRQPSAEFAAIIEEGFNNQVARMIDICAANANTPFTPCFSSPGFSSIVNFGQQLSDLTYNANRDLLRDGRRNLAVFGQVDFQAMDRLNLTMEARYTSEKVRSRIIDQAAIYDYLGAQIGFTSAAEVDRQVTFNSFNPRFTAKYSLNSATNFYAIAAKGNKPGGFNNPELVAQGLGTYGNETIWSFEAGTKNSFNRGGITLNLAVYSNTITDYQLTQSVLLPAIGQTTSAISNLGKVRSQGIEAELNFRIAAIPGLYFSANYALNDASFLQGTDITEGKLLDTLDDGLVNCSIGLANPLAACAAGDNVIPGSIAGRTLPRAPKHMINLGMSYTKPISYNLNFVFNGDISYESKKYVQVQNLAYYGEALLVNANIGFETDSLRVVFWARNITEEDSVVASFRFIDEARSFQRAFGGTPRVPRTVGVRVQKTF
ncbi:MAG: TonB-dependent receptor [Robiginitomaculum sp.]|nr:TonB-dependent receptor [Robiginitomaculum sp.]